METRCYLLPRKVDAAGMAQEVREKSPAALVQATSKVGVTNELVVGMLAEQTARSSEGGCLLARRIEIDFLLRMAGTTQIKDAIHKSGAVKGRANLLTVRSDVDELKALEESALQGFHRLRSGALTANDLKVVERAALLNVLRA